MATGKQHNEVVRKLVDRERRHSTWSAFSTGAPLVLTWRRDQSPFARREAGGRAPREQGRGVMKVKRDPWSFDVTAAAMDPGVICFQHCGPKVFCFSLPDSCPCCKEDLAQANFSLLPFRVPYPFVQASQYPCAVVIKPTTGDFLNDYYNSMDLHIGVTTSTGTIVEFDKNGLRRHRSGQWGQCLLLDQAPGSWTDHWDETLLRVCTQKCWSPKSYSEHKHNCYSFVLTFLVTLDYGKVSAAARSRTAFCERFIVPRTTSAGKYISLYRKLKEYGCYVHKSKTGK